MIRLRLTHLSDVDACTTGSNVRIPSMSKCCIWVSVQFLLQKFFDSYSHALEDIVDSVEEELEEEKENSDSTLESKAADYAYI